MPVATNHGTDMIIKMYVIRPPIWRGTRPSHSITRAKVPAPFAKFNHNLLRAGSRSVPRTLPQLFTASPSTLSWAYQSEGSESSVVPFFSVHLLVEASHTPPALSQLALSVAFVTSPAKTGPGKASATANIEIRVLATSAQPY